MDFGGIIAGALAGGGAAVQDISANRLEQQRTEALRKLEARNQAALLAAREAGQNSRQMRDFDFRRDQAEAEAKSAAEIARIEGKNELQNMVTESRLNIAEDAAKQATSARLGTGDNLTANQRDMNALLAMEGPDGEPMYTKDEAARIAFNIPGGLPYSDALEIVNDQYENMDSISRRRLSQRLEEEGKTIQDYLDEQALNIIERARDVDYGGNQRSGLLTPNPDNEDPLGIR